MMDSLESPQLQQRQETLNKMLRLGICSVCTGFEGPFAMSELFAIS